MTTHTPGPWKVINGTVYIGNAHDALPDDKECICVMELTPRMLRTKQIERNANARLIAAAPELLEVCQTIAKAFVESYGDFKYSEYEHLVLNAIAKAEGR